MIASIHYHSRGADLVELAALTNANRPADDDRFLFDLTLPLQLAYEGGHYWHLNGTSVAGFALHHAWVAVQLEGQPERYREELERCYGIEATISAEVALDRLLAVERRRAAEKETTS